MPGPAPFNPTEGDPVRVLIDGTFYWWDNLTPAQKQQWRKDHPERYQGQSAGTEGGSEFRIAQRHEESLEAAGVETEPSLSNLRSALEGMNADLQSPAVQNFLNTAEQMIDSGQLTEELAFSQAQAIALNNQKAPTEYESALATAGFTGPYIRGQHVGPTSPRPISPGLAQLGAHEGMEPQEIAGEAAPYRQSNETGWTQFGNGVLVHPDATFGSLSGVVFDPSSSAPGSAQWIRGIDGWAPGKVEAWRKKLVEFGYLDKGTKGVTVDFKNALKLYHVNRYINGGKPIGGDVAGGAGAEKPKPINLEDFSAQIRADVREQYERIFGQRPGDGEVDLWSNYIIRQGMSMQRRNISKYDSPMTEAAATEAEEQFIEKLEKSPEARYFREAEEENTDLRDTFERMAQVTSSLVS